jgi:pre-mRNA branch site protein p14
LLSVSELAERSFCVCIAQVHLPPKVSRLLYVRNLPFKVTGDELYEVFGRYGEVRQVRIGDPANKKTRGTAFVAMQDIFDAKSAVDHLSGFSVGGRYLTVLFYKPRLRHAEVDVAKERAEVEELKRKHGLTGDEQSDEDDDAEADDGLPSLAQRRGRHEVGASSSSGASASTASITR